MKVSILNLGIGNLLSVKQALENTGATVTISVDSLNIRNTDALILPGVGNYKAAIKRIEAARLRPILEKWFEQNKPCLGICLGMQLFFSGSQEAEGYSGLNYFNRPVVEIDQNSRSSKPSIKIGWYELKSSKVNTIEALKDNPRMYFLHKYGVEADNAKYISATVDYGGASYVSAVRSGNIWGVQFHPEKSGQQGLNFYRSFLEGI